MERGIRGWCITTTLPHSILSICLPFVLFCYVDKKRWPVMIFLIDKHISDARALDDSMDTEAPPM